MLILFISGFFVFAATAGATTLTWTDDDAYAPSKGGNTITYALDFSFTSSSGGFDTYGATFTIDTTANTSPEWDAGWFLFKFDMGEKGIISNLTYSDPINTWTIDNFGTDVLKAGGTYGALAHDGFTGFYDSSLADPATPPYGTLLTGTPVIGPEYTFAFDFTLPDGVLPKVDMMPFQAGFYDGEAGKSGHTKVNRLSEELSIPDPAAVFLLGPACLIGFAGLRRKFKM